MEPRLNTLLDFSTQSSMPYIAEPSNMSSPGSQLPPHHADHSFVRPRALMLTNTSPESARSNHVRRAGQERLHTARSMRSAPIAHVLNDEANVLEAAQPVSCTFASSATPFSGRLVDLLLDNPDHARQRWDQEQQFLQPENTGCSPAVIKLPRLPQPPKRTAKRPRIPPLLQGLHQPPPLPPKGRLFPPITGEKNAFAGERRYDSRFEESRNKDVDEHATLEAGAIDYSRISQHAEHPSFSQPIVHPVSSSGIDVAYGTDIVTNASKDSQALSQPKRGKKRNKWSEQETKDLLIGVSRYGIGNWKRILQDQEFAFNHRTAVDLKDRFRVCCPGEGLKPRQPKTKGKEKVNADETARDWSIQATYTHQHSLPISGRNPDNSLVSNPPSPSQGQQCGATRSKATTHLDLAELGIHEPFSKATRRPRRAFSTRDDVNLLKGFEKYGPQWHLMRDDGDLDFSTRHPTDLRDRFRIRYPDKYAKAGYKVKAKEKERTLSKQAQERGMQEECSQRSLSILVHNPSHQAEISHPQNNNTIMERDVNPSNNNGPNTSISLHFPIPSTHNVNNLNPALKLYNPSSYLSDPLPTLPFDDADTDLTQDMSTVGDESPITLSRNILRWADANPASLYAFPTASTASACTSTTSMGNVLGGGLGNKGAGDCGAAGGGYGAGGEGDTSGGFNGFMGGVGGGQQQMDSGRGIALPEPDSWLLGGERDKALGMYRYRS